MCANWSVVYDLPPRALIASGRADDHVVRLGDVLYAPELAADFRPLLVALGVDEAERPVAVDLARAPHTLVSGATGSGKSTCINALIVSILARSTPDEVRMVLVDTKRVELAAYEGIPHLITSIITSPKKAAEALQWVVREMDLRYDNLAASGFRHVDDFNKAVRSGKLKPLPGSGREYRPYPYLLVIVDDFADLVRSQHGDQALKALTAIASLGRIVGIHAVIVTQYPGSEVIPRGLAVNIPYRLAFGSASSSESWHALGVARARRLPPGGLLLRSLEASAPRTIRGALVSYQEIDAVVAHCVRQLGTNADSNAREAGGVASRPPQNTTPCDVLLRSAELVIATQQGPPGTRSHRRQDA